MTVYIHEFEGWPSFEWSERDVASRLAAVRHRQGRLLGRMDGLGFDLRAEAVLNVLTEDVTKSSEIEGEHLDRALVRSSVARRLGLDVAGTSISDRNVDGVVEMMLDATQSYDKTLTKKRLCAWHAALFPTGHNGMTKITVGAWRKDRNGPMQVVSGPYGRERVHYEAPPAARLSAEMKAFLVWFNGVTAVDPVLKAAIAHLWFVTIHPFDDSNGRIARAIADMALARSEGSPQRFYSMSAQILRERSAYYDVLELTQKSGLDITAWLEWFLVCLDRALDDADRVLASVLRKARFWKTVTDVPLNERQRRVLSRLLDNFEGKLTSSKWAKLAKTSPDTALRDISDLVARGILVKDAGGGRNTSYSLGL